METDPDARPVHGGHLVARERLPAGPPQATIVLLHGFGGDERSMWVFEKALPEAARVIALRGLFPAEGGGYRWHQGQRWPPPSIRTLDESVAAVRGSLAGLGIGNGGAIWVGFSQGAALGFACAAGGLPTVGVASLAGYLPETPTAWPEGMPVFWAHGIRDRHVPIRMARAAISRLREQGALVETCETDVGHRVGLPCTRALEGWLRQFSSHADPRENR